MTNCVKQPGHTQYLVEYDGDDCMEVFRQPVLPKVGAFHGGKLVQGMRATRIIKGLYVVDMQTCDPLVVMHVSGMAAAERTLIEYEVKHG